MEDIYEFFDLIGLKFYMDLLHGMFLLGWLQYNDWKQNLSTGLIFKKHVKILRKQNPSV